MPLTDETGVLFALLGGRPEGDSSWQKCIKEATKLIGKIRSQCSFMQEQKDHRCGKHPALTGGISHGGGQKVSLPSSLGLMTLSDPSSQQPGNLQHNKKNANAIKTLANHWTFRRLSGFANG
jgi:hypothetical protein